MTNSSRIAAATVSLLATAVLLFTGERAFSQPHGGDRLGTVHFPVACNPAVQEKFDRAAALLHNFVFPDTIKAFTAVIQEDPSCAMGYWGLAMSQRPNPLVPPFDAAALKRGWEAVQQGLGISPQDARERGYLEAMAEFYREYATVDQATRARAYAAAMGRLHDSYPDDPEAAVFYALALNEAADLSDKGYTNQLKAVAILQGVGQKQPNHPGVAHYLIHSYDFAPMAALCLPIARHYAELAPAAPHALHMPSHIYSMLGMWEDSIASNIAAEAAARDQAAQAFPGKDHPSVPHLRDFRVYAYLQMGQDGQAKKLADEVQAMNLAIHTLAADTGQQAILARYAIDRGRWDDAAHLDVLESKHPPALAIGYFTRGIGAARSGDLQAARTELARLGEVKSKLVQAHDEYWAGQTEIQIKALAAWIDFADGKRDTAIEAMRAAADLDDASEKNVSMENKLLPVRALLGELFLAADMNADALDAFETSAKVLPNRFRTLLGAAQAARGLNNADTAKQYYRALVGLAVHADTERPELVEAKTYLASR
jgi:tetratricopeptide (TPR) repeat protein